MEGGSADTFFLLKWKSAAISFFFKHTWSGWWYQSSLDTFWVGGGALGQPSFNLNCLIESNVRGGLEKLARPVDKSMSQLPGQVMAYLQHTRPFIPQQCVHTSRKDSLQLFFVVVVVFSSLSQTQDKEKKKKKFWKETVHAASCAVFCFVSLFFFYFHFPPSSTSILLRELLYFGQPSPSAASRGGQWRRPAAVPGMSSGTLLVVFFFFFFRLFLSSKRERKIDPLWLSLSLECFWSESWISNRMPHTRLAHFGRSTVPYESHCCSWGHG